MSFIIDYKNLSNSEKALVQSHLILKKPLSKFGGETQYVKAFSIQNGQLVLPFAFAKNYFAKHIIHQSFSKNENLRFTGVLNDIQQSIKKQTFEILNKTHNVVLSLACGMGKTAMAIYLCSKLQYRTLIICHRIVLINQWKESIQKFCNMATVQILTANNTKNDCDFYIINLTNLTKRNDLFDIGVVVCDEAHVIATDKLFQGLFCIKSPKYCIGLTATPDRPDGMNVILDLQFGTQKVIKKAERQFDVLCINSNFDINIEKSKSGGLDWNSVIESQSMNENRNKLIADLAIHFVEDNIIIACKRVEQANIIHQLLLSKNQNSTIFTGSEKSFDVKSRILVTTFSKGSTGLDHPKLNLMIIASDIKNNVEQLIGRIFRSQSTRKLVIDIVDRFRPLRNHWFERKELYQKLGGSVSNFEDKITDFNCHTI